MEDSVIFGFIGAFLGKAVVRKLFEKVGIAYMINDALPVQGIIFDNIVSGN